jgi:hypothetical protein
LPPVLRVAGFGARVCDGIVPDVCLSVNSPTVCATRDDPRYYSTGRVAATASSWFAW